MGESDDIILVAGQARGRRAAVVVPAKNEAHTIEATVRSALTIDQVDLVVVVDDGSSDDTAALALAAGARVVRHARAKGKAGAMTTGAAEVAARYPDHVLLFIDGDVGNTAVATSALVSPVLSGAADMTIALLPAQSSAGGGHGLVVALAAKGIRDSTGWTPQQPLSGMRCVSRRAFEAALPLAPGWGVETAMTIDLLSAGFTIVEVPCALQHRVTGSDLRSQLHRAEQYRDVALALAVRRARRSVPLGWLHRLGQGARGR